MSWHEFNQVTPNENQKILLTDGNRCFAFAIWRGGLSNVMGLSGELPRNYSAFSYWISLDELLGMLK